MSVAAEAPNSGDSNATRRCFPALFSQGYCAEVKELFRLQLPAFLTCFLQLLPQTVSMIICGHISKQALDAVSLAMSFINGAGLCLGLGAATACETLFSQAFGSWNKKKVGLYLQRSFLFMYSLMFLLYSLHLMSRPLFRLLQQSPVTSSMASDYVFLFMPGVFGDFTFLVLSRYMQCQSLVFPPLICAVLGNVVNAISQYLAVYVFHLSYLSSAVCHAACMITMAFSLLLYIMVSKVYTTTWDGWTKETFYDTWSYVKIAVPGMVFVWTELIAYEIGAIVSGTISSVQLAAQGIMFQTTNLTYMISIGMSVAASIRVGQNLGANNPKGAIHSCKVSLTLILTIAIITATAYGVFHRHIPKIFSSDPEVIDYTAKLLLLFTVAPFVEGLGDTSAGALKGCARQLIVASVNSVSFVVVGLPIGVCLALLTRLETFGFWLGLTIGMGLQACLLVSLTYKINWEVEATRAVSRSAPKYQQKLDRTESESSEEKALIAKQELPPFAPVLIRRLVLTIVILTSFFTCLGIRLYKFPMSSVSVSCTHLQPASNLTLAPLCVLLE